MLQVIEITSAGTKLKAQYGSLKVTVRDGSAAAEGEHAESHLIPFDNIESIVLPSYGVSVSSGMLSRCGELNIPVVVLGKNYHPVSMSLALQSNTAYAQRFDAQLEAGLPLKKKLWQAVVAAKILMQAQVLESVGGRAAELRDLSKEVKAGDTTNTESQAARMYWPRLFGQGFIRDLDQHGVNALLNYGYAIMRACVARRIVAAGLLPALGLFHKNFRNAFRLADDLMEPFRPLVDIKVWDLAACGFLELTPEVKKELSGLLDVPMDSDMGVSPLSAVVGQLATSLAQVYLKERDGLALQPKKWRMTIDEIRNSTRLAV